MNKTQSDPAAEQMWSLYASSYDQVLLRLPFYTGALARHMKHIDARKPGRVMDFGAGTGNMTMQLVDRGIAVSAIDQSPAMLDKLMKKLSTRERVNVDIVCQSVEALDGFDNASFDAVTCLLVLYAVKDQAAALDEALRVLKPGGLLVMTEPNQNFQLQPLLDFGLAHLKKTGAYDALKEDWSRVMNANAVFDPSYGTLVRAEEIETRLKGDGFTDIMVEPSHLGHCSTVSGIKPTQ